jgi:hypothetical protein
MKRLDRVIATITNKYIIQGKVYVVLGVKAKGDRILIATELKERKYLRTDLFIPEAQEQQDMVNRLEERGF